MTQNIDDRLRLLVERVERLEEEKKAINADVRDVYNEAKAVGYDTKIMRKIIALRKMKPDDRREMDMLLDTYRCALGMDDSDTPDMFAKHDGRPIPELPPVTRTETKEEVYSNACELVLTQDKLGTSWLQRQLGIGFNEAARLVERMEAEGLVTAASPVGTRNVIKQESKPLKSKPKAKSKVTLKVVATEAGAHL